MNCIAFCDTNTLSATVKMFQTLPLAGIRPIIGMDLTIEVEGVIANGALFVSNQIGWDNLLALHQLVVKQGFVSLDNLLNHAQGLVFITGGVGGLLSMVVNHLGENAAFKLIHQLKSQFKSDLYLEIQRLELPGEAMFESFLKKTAKYFNIDLVATNLMCFDVPSKYAGLMAINNSADFASQVTCESYFKSPKEMASLFIDLQDALKNTVVIAKKCQFALQPSYPRFPTNQFSHTQSAEQKLRIQAKAGLKYRIATSGPDYAKYETRLDYELDVITSKGFAAYFLICKNIVNWARDQKIAVGPGRGSAAGCLVSWAIGITEINPIKHGLIFERFLNPERPSLPDIDLDFCSLRHDEVVEFIKREYGYDKVAKVAAFSRIQPKSALKDCAKSSGIPADTLEDNLSFNKVYQSSAALIEAGNVDEQLREVIQLAGSLDGVFRQSSIHAAGIVISDQPLLLTVPLKQDELNNSVVTFDKNDLDYFGLVKFDILGVKDLSIIAQTEADIKQNHSFNLTDIPLNDPATFQLLGRGETLGCFQLESAKMRQVLKELGPTSLDDIITVISLYRPGAMDSITNYIARKNMTAPVEYLHPLLEPVLKETFGIFVYQEQVLETVRVIGGQSYAQADLFRKAISKKDSTQMAELHDKFCSGAATLNVSKNTADKIFESIAKFSGYGFSKSHAAPYALTAYRMAYIKANYPLPFYKAVLNSRASNREELLTLIEEARNQGIAILPVDINTSSVCFEIEETSLRTGLAIIKGISEATAKKIVEERMSLNIESFADLCQLKCSQSISILTKLIKSGALDVLGESRRVLLGYLTKKGKPLTTEEDQPSADSPMTEIIEVFNLLGFFPESHPLSLVKPIKGMIFAEHFPQGETFQSYGFVHNVVIRQDKNNNAYCRLVLSDPTGSYEAIVFASVFRLKSHLCQKGHVLVFSAKKDTAENVIISCLKGVEGL
jgi:DNA polymerase-3 subunit alpha